MLLTPSPVNRSLPIFLRVITPHLFISLSLIGCVDHKPKAILKDELPKALKAQPLPHLQVQTPQKRQERIDKPHQLKRHVRSLDELRILAQEVYTPDRLTDLARRAKSERWRRSHTLRVGPIPDYAPISRVYAHQQLASLAPQSALHIAEQLQDLFEVEDYNPSEQGHSEEFVEDTMLLWLRDYHPIYMRSITGDLTAVQYLAYNQNRARYAIKQDFSSRSSTGLTAQMAIANRPQDKQLAQKLLIKPNQRSIDQQQHLPLIHENGNLIIAGPWLFISDRILDDNSDEESEEHLIEGGYLSRDRDGVLSELSRALEIPRERIVILPKLPHEATGHVDLYLMAINDHQVIIPKIMLSQKVEFDPGIEAQIARDVRGFLNERADQLAMLGLEVIRLPMIPPLYLPALDEPEGNYDVVFYSPTNGLLVNTSERQQVLLPHFNADMIRPEIKELSESYERHWFEVFSALGWQPSFVETTTLGRYLGLIHCVTAGTPKLPLREDWLKLRNQR